MLTWNPSQKRPETLKHIVAQIARGKPCKDEWSTGVRKDLPPRSRVFLIRQTKEPKGVVASGYTLTEPRSRNSPDDHSNYCKLVWTMALDAEGGEVLSLGELNKDPVLAQVPWGIAGGGREFTDEEAGRLEAYWSQLLVRQGKGEVVSRQQQGVTERPLIRGAEAYDIEGMKTETVKTTSRRSRRLRDLAFQAAKGVCCVCKTDFSKVLGGRGIRVLQVHHRRQLSALDAPMVTKVGDLAVVCANCHLLLHFDPKQAMVVEELRGLLRKE